MTPGGGAGVALGPWGLGGGGGAGHGDLELGLDDVLAFAEDEDVDADVLDDDGDTSGAVAPGTAASFLNSSILSLYASFNSPTSFSPCSFAFDSSLSLYLASTRSWAPWVAR